MKMETRANPSSIRFPDFDNLQHEAYCLDAEIERDELAKAGKSLRQDRRTKQIDFHDRWPIDRPP
jgi:hypothetical protein